MDTHPHFQAVLLDMDGVIYRGDHALPGAAELFPALQWAGVSVILVTNNSQRTAAGVVRKLEAMGIRVRTESILTSSMATARWLHEQAPEGAQVYIVGAADLAKVVLEQPGFTMDAVLDRVAQEGDLFAGVLGGKQSLTTALKAIR